MRSYHGLDHLLAVAFMGLASCGAGQSQEPKGSSEVIRPAYPEVPGFPMADPTTHGVAPNTAVYPAPKTVAADPLPAETPSLAYENTPAPSPVSPAPTYGNIQSFHAEVVQPKGKERESVLHTTRAWEQSSKSVSAPSLKPGLYEVRDGSLTRLLVVEEGGVVVGTMSYRSK